jgi:hypothetical protein|tara:strand:+ start:332 stop:490 length:159 start_codon:yes stop_codon:yes gene_type:complete
MKKRTLNEYRQSKDFGYNNKVVRKCSVGEMCKRYPNDAELGREIRKIFSEIS